MTRLSFECFPPQNLAASFRLWDTVRELAAYAPEFVSVTYGAGGTTRALTQEAVTTIAREFGLPMAAHLTCVNATREETLEIAQGYAEAGISRLVALRGDPPKGSGAFAPHPEGFADSVELIGALAATKRFTLYVGAYPDPHPESQGSDADIDWLKRKIDAGGDAGITQFFFEPDTFFRFRDRCAAAGIAAPILPGILPIENWNGVRKFAASCGAHIPDWLPARFEAATTPEAQRALATELCIDLSERLIAGGVPHLHFYTLNKAAMTRAVIDHLGIARAQAA